MSRRRYARPRAVHARAANSKGAIGSSSGRFLELGAAIGLESHRIGTSGTNAESEGPPPILETRVSHRGHKRSRFDAARPRIHEQLGEVGRPRARSVRLPGIEGPAVFALLPEQRSTSVPRRAR
jgi:hypothetical protein